MINAPLLVTWQVDVAVGEESALLTRIMLGDIKDKAECATVRHEGRDAVRIIGTKKQVRW
jgi:hypothetical protein